MKLYVGSRDFKPDGYKTVDLDSKYNPDFVADIRDLKPIPDCSCSEVVSGSVLEHLDWPDGFKAIAEFARVLEIGGKVKISVPDMDLLMRMVLHGDSSFHVMALIYGVGGRTNPFEAHRYGYTVGMLVDILEVLGFEKFDWWNSDQPDASNGWIPRYDNSHVGCDHNIAAIKISEPSVPVKELYDALCKSPMSDFCDVAAQVRMQAGIKSDGLAPSRVYQRIHVHLVNEQQHIRHIENQKPTGRLSRWLHSIGL